MHGARSWPTVGGALLVVLTGCSGNAPTPPATSSTTPSPVPTTAIGMAETPLHFPGRSEAEAGARATLPVDAATGAATDGGAPGACRNVALDRKRRTTCCPDAVRSLVRPDELLATCPEAHEYLYEEYAGEEACIYFYKRGDAVIRVLPSAAFDPLHERFEDRPGFQELPEVGAKAFLFAPGKPWSPWERRFYLRVGERMLSLSVRPKTCTGEQARALAAFVAERFARGLGGPPTPDTLDLARLKELVPGADEPEPPAPVPEKRLPR